MRELVRKSLQIGGAFVGLIVGGGFASGQEILQFFTGFGWYGLLGGILATLCFAFLGMNVAQLGCELQTTSHKKVVFHIAGRHFGLVIDFLITLLLFAITVAMFAGGASTLNQMFGLNHVFGSLIMAILTISTLMLNVKSIINVIALATPYLLAVILIIAIYSIFTMDLSFAEADRLAREQSTAAPNWIMGSLLYVSYNIAGGLTMLTVMGSTVKSKKVAGFGGIIGGVLLGILIILMNIALLAKMDIITGTDMPILVIANNIHPIVGVLMTIALLGMIYNTAVGMLFSFVVRFVQPKDKSFKRHVLYVGIIGYIASFVGFTTIVGKVYSTMGYLGFAIMIAIVYSWMRRRKNV